MAISRAKRLAAARVLGAWRRQSKDKRPTHAALAKKLQITPSTLRYIASKCLRRQKEVILERDRIETLDLTFRKSSRIESKVFSARSVRRFRRPVRYPRQRSTMIRRERRFHRKS